MNATNWKQIQSQYKLGQFIQREIEFHTPFGVFLKIDESPVIFDKNERVETATAFTKQAFHCLNVSWNDYNRYG